MILAFSSIAQANPQIENPVLIRKNYIEVYFMPFHEKDINDQFIHSVIQDISKIVCDDKTIINISCLIPKNENLGLIYTYLEKSKKLRKDSLVLPASEFWTDANIA